MIALLAFTLFSVLAAWTPARSSRSASCRVSAAGCSIRSGRRSACGRGAGLPGQDEPARTPGRDRPGPRAATGRMACRRRLVAVDLPHQRPGGSRGRSPVPAAAPPAGDRPNGLGTDRLGGARPAVRRCGAGRAGLHPDRRVRRTDLAGRSWARRRCPARRVLHPRAADRPSRRGPAAAARHSRRGPPCWCVSGRRTSLPCRSCPNSCVRGDPALLAGTIGIPQALAVSLTLQPAWSTGSRRDGSC